MRAFMRFSGLALFLLVPLAHAVEDSLKIGAYQAAVEQEQLRAQTKRLMADMNRMLDEFRGNPAATEEVALTEATIKKLETLSETDMASVVATLREASSAKSENAADQILSANKTAKDVQSALVRLADKLALFQDESSVDIRLTGLIRRQIANQRQTKYLSDGSIESAELPRETELAASEQKAIREDLDSLLQTLQHLSTNSASTGQSVFADIYQAALLADLAKVSESAQTSAAAKDFPATIAAQGKVIGGLQDMLLALNSSKPLEERLRTAETQMRTLAGREEVLARTTTKTSVEIQGTVARRQNEIADQRTLLEKEIAKLNAGTVPLLGQTAQTMDKLDSDLRKNRGLIGNADKKLEVVTTQNGVAGNFRQLAEMLKKQADQVASSSSGGGEGGGSESLSNAATAISEAVGSMESAENLLGQGGDTNSAQNEMNKAGGKLDEAMKALGDSGDSAPPSAGEDLGKSKESLGEGGKEASKGQGGPERAKANAAVGKAKELANAALSKIQAQMAAEAESTGMLTGSEANGANGQSTGTGGGAGWGTIFKHKSQGSAVSALAKISEQDRQALSMVQQEKAPPEYGAMAEQYLKNLSEGATSAH